MNVWTPDAVALSADLAKVLGQASWLDSDDDFWIANPDLTDGAEFLVRSRTHREIVYPMVRTPEGYAVHQGEGCEGEIFNGVLGCWHSKTYRRTDMTNTALTVAQSTALAAPVEYSREQIEVMKRTICKGASDAELQMFVFACQSLQLDPFLKQIWAIQRRSKVPGSRDEYETTMTIQVGIDGYRVMRDRIRDANNVPLFEGMDGPQWSGDGKQWDDFPPPLWEKGAELYSRVGVWRRGIPRPFIGVCRMSAYYQDVSMWKTMGPEQLAKCSEALALRRAFPAEMSKLPSGPVMDFDETQLGDTPTAPKLTAPPEGVIDGEIIEHGAEEKVATARGDGSAAGVSLAAPQASSSASPSPPAAPTPPEPGSAPLRERLGVASADDYDATVRAINAVLDDVKATADKAYVETLTETMRDKFPEVVGAKDGKTYPGHISAENAPALLAWLREQRGDPAEATAPALPI